MMEDPDLDPYLWLTDPDPRLTIRNGFSPLWTFLNVGAFNHFQIGISRHFSSENEKSAATDGYRYISVCTLHSSVADPDPGSGIGCFLTPGSGIRDPE